MENNSSKQQILDTLTANIRSDWRPIELPSKSLIYGEIVVEIKPWGFEEERLLTSTSKRDKDQVINNIMSRCVKGISISDLLIADKLFLLFKIREISYGNSYEVAIQCQHCDYNNGLLIELNKLEVTYAPEDIREKKTLFLPNSGLHVVVRLPRVEDEVLFKADSLIDILHEFILSVEGNDDRHIIQGVVRRLLSSDLAILKKEILSLDFGLQTDIKFECSNCKKMNLVDLPLTADFFSMSSTT